MVHFPGFARARLWIHRAVRGFYPRGFPHSEIPGSKPACGSPGLIAACHVLHRLLLPRHPPCALSSLTTKFTRYTAASSSLTSCHELFSFWLLAHQQELQTPHAEKFYGPLDPAPRTLSFFSTPLSLVIPGTARDLETASLKPNATYTSRLSSGTHKNLRSPCNLPNLFSCQISSSAGLL